MCIHAGFQLPRCSRCFCPPAWEAVAGLASLGQSSLETGSRHAVSVSKRAAMMAMTALSLTLLRLKLENKICYNPDLANRNQTMRFFILAHAFKPRNPKLAGATSPRALKPRALCFLSSREDKRVSKFPTAIRRRSLGSGFHSRCRGERPRCDCSQQDTHNQIE